MHDDLVTNLGRLSLEAAHNYDSWWVSTELHIAERHEALAVMARKTLSKTRLNI